MKSISRDFLNPGEAGQQLELRYLLPVAKFSQIAGAILYGGHRKTRVV